jgi:hypothetical protein
VVDHDRAWRHGERERERLAASSDHVNDRP